MTKRDTPQDLDKYLPDEAAMAASMTARVTYGENVDPKLIARLEELNRLSSDPDLLRAAPPSVTEYVPPTEVPGANADDTTLRRDEPKVQVVRPPSRNDSPTLPSLRRLEGEPELPGVVRGTHGRSRPMARTAVLALLAVLVPVVLLLGLKGRSTGSERGCPASTGTTIEPQRSAAPSATASSTAAPSESAVPVPAPSAAPASSAAAAPTANATTSAVVPTAMGAAPRPRPRATAEDPYDAPRPAPSTTAVPSATAAPSATPKAGPGTVPTAPPAAPSSTQTASIPPFLE